MTSMLSKAHYLKVAKYYHEQGKTALTDKERAFFKSKEEHFLNAGTRDERKVAEQSQWEKQKEQEEQMRDWSGL
ncbi:MAG: hypothetical protein J6S85_05795 [Methanobrevibacter sp.]|nr:hypothetical protein [Methanobrevibacter sp.]